MGNLPDRLGTGTVRLHITQSIFLLFPSQAAPGELSGNDQLAAANGRQNEEPEVDE